MLILSGELVRPLLIKDLILSRAYGGSEVEKYTVFTSFYLNELAYELDDVRSLSSFIITNQVINQ